MTTVRDLLTEARLSLPNSESPSLDAIVLLESVSQRDRAFILAEQREPVERLLSEEGMTRFQGYVSRRSAGEPIAYILGKKEFYGRDFFVGPGALVPRPDSECVVEAVLRIVNTEIDASGPWIVDCCTGTGCIGISVALELSERDEANAATLHVTLTDLDDLALSWAKRNVSLHNDAFGPVEIDLVQGDLLSPISEITTDRGRLPNLIVANPPYLTTAETATPTVQGWQEPRLALDGGEYGLYAIERLVPQAFSFLASGGYLVLEHGAHQGPQVSELLRNGGFRKVVTRQDLAGNDRYTEGRKREAPG